VKMFDADKNTMIGLPCGEKNYDDMLSRFHLIPDRHGQTDRFAISISLSRVSILTRDKNDMHRPIQLSLFLYLTYFICFK